MRPITQNEHAKAEFVLKDNNKEGEDNASYSKQMKSSDVAVRRWEHRIGSNRSGAASTQIAECTGDHQFITSNPDYGENDAVRHDGFAHGFSSPSRYPED